MTSGWKTLGAHLNLDLWSGLQVEEPCRCGVAPTFGPDHDVVVTVPVVEQRGGADPPGLASPGAEQQHRNPTDPFADPATRELIDELMSSEHAKADNSIERSHRHTLRLDHRWSGPLGASAIQLKRCNGLGSGPLSRPDT